MLGTQCLSGDLLAFGPSDERLSINAICTDDNEQGNRLDCLMHLT